MKLLFYGLMVWNCFSTFNFVLVVCHFLFRRRRQLRILGRCWLLQFEDFCLVMLPGFRILVFLPLVHLNLSATRLSSPWWLESDILGNLFILVEEDNNFHVLLTETLILTLTWCLHTLLVLPK